mmetsp:Transcript_40857/g.87022  ORF Transcript_40857/g.87022 Transcript_40857/m.87022 type:complete len:82 (+) Transcript_40857:1176-1421(+)
MASGSKSPSTAARAVDDFRGEAARLGGEERERGVGPRPRRCDILTADSDDADGSSAAANSSAVVAILIREIMAMALTTERL